MTPIKAIRAKCLDCCCNMANEVKLCPITECSLYPYRMGKNPNRTSNMTDEQRQAASERGKTLAAMRKKQTSTLEENT